MFPGVRGGVEQARGVLRGMACALIGIKRTMYVIYLVYEMDAGLVKMITPSTQRECATQGIG